MSNDTNGQQADKILEFLKREAKLLQQAAEADDPRAKARLQEHSPAVGLGAPLQRKHALATIAREIGFPNWKGVVGCFERGNGDFAKFLHPRRCHVFWNIWSASYEEAKTIRADHGGFLLTYGNQFLIVDDDYVAALGVPADDPRWEQIGRDWYEPIDPSTRWEMALLVAERSLSAVAHR